MSDVPRFETFEQFWPYYVREHAKPLTRWMHFVGTTVAVSIALSALRRPSRAGFLVPAALVAGYGPAWISHFFVENNRPATFTYPRWSLLADFKMWGLIVAGKMDAEVARVLAEYDARAQSNGAPKGNNAAVSVEPRRVDPMAN